MFLGAGDHSYRVTKDHVPPETNIIAATMDPDGWRIWLTLEGPGFAEVEAGVLPPMLEPVMSALVVDPVLRLA